jgi:succinate dehydrogenase/fumarate reductase flavoprotein subunit
MLSHAKHPSDLEFTQETGFYTEVAEVGRRSQRERSHPIHFTTDYSDGSDTDPKRMALSAIICAICG